MIKKGLTHTKTQTFSRPKTAGSGYKSYKDRSQTIDKNKDVDSKAKTNKKYETLADSTI